MPIIEPKYNATRKLYMNRRHLSWIVRTLSFSNHASVVSRPNRHFSPTRIPEHSSHSCRSLPSQNMQILPIAASYLPLDSVRAFGHEFCLNLLDHSDAAVDELLVIIASQEE
jgi:hypothetical protein